MAGISAQVSLAPKKAHTQKTVQNPGAGLAGRLLLDHCGHAHRSDGESRTSHSRWADHRCFCSPCVLSGGGLRGCPLAAAAGPQPWAHTRHPAPLHFSPTEPRKHARRGKAGRFTRTDTRMRGVRRKGANNSRSSALLPGSASRCRPRVTGPVSGSRGFPPPSSVLFPAPRTAPGSDGGWQISAEPGWLPVPMGLLGLGVLFLTCTKLFDLHSLHGTAISYTE